MRSKRISLKVVDALNKHEIPYMLVGSLATNFYSIARSTKDADIVIQASLIDTARILASECRELRIDPQFGFEGVTSTARILLRTGRPQFIVELFALSDDLHDQERFRRRVQADWEGRPTWIATLEDALVTKLRWAGTAGREKDYVDARNVIATSGERVDWPYVERWCDVHGSRPLLDRLREELKRR
jgi:hypothetical protein